MDTDHPEDGIVIDTYASSSCPDRLTCPAGHRINTLPGGRVVQGKKIPDDVRAALVRLGMPVSEDAVWIPDELEV